MKVRADILRTYQVIHSWTGILSGLLLFIGFFAGAIILFQKPITKWASPASTQLKSIELAQYDNVLQQVFANYAITQQQVTVNLHQELSPVTWSHKPSRDIHLVDQQWHASLDGDQQLYTNTVQPNLLATLIDQLHRNAGLIGEVGHEHWGGYLMGVAAILYFLALISGLIFLLPTLVKHFFALRRNKSAARFWLDLHNLLGITSFPFHLIIAFTVVVFVFHDFFYQGLEPIYADQAMFSRPPASVEPFDVTNLKPLAEMIRTVEGSTKGYQVQHINFTGLNSTAPMAMVAVANPSDIVRGPYVDYIFMHPYSLEIYAFGNAHQPEGIWAKIVRSFFALHFGSFGGDSARWLYFLLGIGGAVIFYTGNLLWLDKKFKKNQVEQKTSVRVLAKLTVAIPLGSMLGVAMAFALTKVLVLSDVAINQAYLFVYYSCFTAALIFAFYRGHQLAGVQLSYLLSVTLASVPLMSLVLHGLQIWPVVDSSNWWLDAISGLLALAFFQLAKQTQRRVTTGDKQSLWVLEAKGQ